MRKKLNKIVLSTCMITSSLLAEASFLGDTNSLVGLEGGYSSLSADRVFGSQSSLEKPKLGHVGLKIGAQSDEFRVFLSGRYYAASDFDYLTTYGVELQYMINFTDSYNIYFGIGTGISKMRYAPANETPRILDDSYVSADLGTNIHLTDSLDLELGVRYTGLDAANTIDSIEYVFDDLITAYTSIVYKFKIK